MHRLSFERADRRESGTAALHWLDRLAARHRRYRDANRLAALPDHLLADIGLTRDAVRRAR
jgi:uncharacterized protein YjiS (DUF1127 family)